MSNDRARRLLFLSSVGVALLGCSSDEAKDGPGTTAGAGTGSGSSAGASASPSGGTTTGGSSGTSMAGSTPAPASGGTGGAGVGGGADAGMAGLGGVAGSASAVGGSSSGSSAVAAGGAGVSATGGEPGSAGMMVAGGNGGSAGQDAGHAGMTAAAGTSFAGTGTGGQTAMGDTWESYAKGFFASYCVSCHNDDDSGDATRDFHELEVVIAQKQKITCGVSKSQADWMAHGCSGTPAARQFPVGSGPKPSDEERDRLLAWMDAGSP